MQPLLRVCGPTILMFEWRLQLECQNEFWMSPCNDSITSSTVCLKKRQLSRTTAPFVRMARACTMQMLPLLFNPEAHWVEVYIIFDALFEECVFIFASMNPTFTYKSFHRYQLLRLCLPLLACVKWFLPFELGVDLGKHLSASAKERVV